MSQSKKPSAADTPAGPGRDAAASASQAQIQIVPAAPAHVESFWRCLDDVAQERTGLAITRAFPLHEMHEFVAKNIADGMPAFFALDGQRVVGWADIRREPRPAHQHRAVLGMGVHQAYRGRGIGHRLLATLVAQAKTIPGLVRIDLTVYAGNLPALAIYRKCGFEEEGRIIKGRYLDGHFDDVLQMGLLLHEQA